jgi:hypothetical protein
LCNKSGSCLWIYIVWLVKGFHYNFWKETTAAQLVGPVQTEALAIKTKNRRAAPPRAFVGSAAEKCSSVTREKESCPSWMPVQVRYIHLESAGKSSDFIATREAAATSAEHSYLSKLPAARGDFQVLCC